MKFINTTLDLPKEQAIALLSDTKYVNENVKFFDDNRYPRMTIKENGERIKISCEIMGGAKKDNAFLEGTHLYGRIRDNGESVTLKGVILTAPIYHFILLVFMAIFIGQCFYLGGFSVVPICLLVFSLFMFKDEFKKQRLIYNYVLRANKRADGYKSKR